MLLGSNTLTQQPTSLFHGGKRNTRGQSNCSAWYQERAFRITASRFGEVVFRKAPVNDRFLHSLFSSTKVLTEAMKYGLDNETVVVKEFKELSGAQVKVFKCGLLVHPDIYWMGCSPSFQSSLARRHFGEGSIMKLSCARCELRYYLIYISQQ